MGEIKKCKKCGGTKIEMIYVDGDGRRHVLPCKECNGKIIVDKEG